MAKLNGNLLDQGQWRIGNGKSTHDGSKPWVHRGKSILDHNVIIPDDFMHALVTDLVTAEGDWNWKTLEWLPSYHRLSIQAILPSAIEYEEDKLLVSTKDDHSYAIRSMYRLLMEDVDGSVDREVWRKVWELKVPERVGMFI